MPQPSNRYEKQFLDALKSLFIGAKVEGDSGYINLMRIKSSYFQNGVFPQLMRDIEAACAPFEPGFREELFDKLYDFFQHYFSESGSIYFRNTAQHHNIYEKVYTDDRDVILFWKTHMLYYVKTDRLFNSMEVEMDSVKFFFDVSAMELKRSNEKRELIYALQALRDDKIVLSVSHSEKGRKTKADDILKAVKTAGAVLDEETLEKACRVFEKQSEVDYFINKNARAFLQEQFDLWMFQYLFKGDSVFGEARLRQLRTIKEIAFKIIDFIAQFEDELVKIWNKPKFVRNSHYVITLDKLFDSVIASPAGTKQSPAKDGETLIDRLFAHAGMTTQIAEWRDLGMLDDKTFSFSENPKGLLENLQQSDLAGEPLHPQYRFLPLDTRYFPDLELDILARFDDLDAALDGWLIHSENYQALNTLLPKFRENIDTSFIDPPYNTTNDEFIYQDKYRHSAWLTMIENRLYIAKELLKIQGAFFTSIDDNEVARLRICGENVFGNDNFVANVIWQKKYTRSNDARWFSDNHDHILVFAKNKEQFSPFLMPRSEKQLAAYSNPDNHPKGSWKSTPLHAKSGNFTNFVFKFKNGVVWSPPPGTFPRFSSATLTKLDEAQEIWFGDNGKSIPSRKTFLSEVKEGVTPITIWNYKDVGHNHEAISELKDIFPSNPFANPKPTRLIQYIIELSCSSENGHVLDFFAGSGTTAHAVMNLNRADGGKRKYILVEMGEHFNTVILQRVKKVAFSSKWKDGKAVTQTSEVSKTSEVSTGMSHFVKYFELEQYEDALRKARYEDAPLFAEANAYGSYAFMRDKKMLGAVALDHGQNTVAVDLGKLYAGIDLAETLSCLTGKWIKRISREAVEFADGSTVDLTAPVWNDVKPLIWW